MTVMLLRYTENINISCRFIDLLILIYSHTQTVQYCQRQINIIQ